MKVKMSKAGTKSLIDSDNSTESDDIILGHSLANSAASINGHSGKEKHSYDQSVLPQNPQDNYKNEERSSDIPLLIDASDCDDTQSQVSNASSLWSSQHDPMNRNLEKNHDEREISDGEGRQKHDVNGGKKPAEGILNAISEETFASINTVRTSNKDVHESNSNLDNDVPILEIRTQEDAFEITREHNDEFSTSNPDIHIQDKKKSPDKSQYKGIAQDPRQKSQNQTMHQERKSRMFEDSINYVIDFFSCSTPNLKIHENCFGKDQENREKDNQLHSLQTCIETDILNLMGCSAEGAHNLIDSFGESMLCNQCVWENDDDDNSLHGKFNDKDSPNRRPKIKNRNVYGRQKALKRIRHLRQSGLSRHFTLAPVANFLAEDVSNTMYSSKNSNVLSSGPRKDGKKKGSLIPLSKRPKALGGDNRETSLGGSSTTSYELTIMTTRSYDICCDDDGGDKEVQSEVESDSGSIFCAQSILFSLLFRPSQPNGPSTSHHRDPYEDLFYDSDPGTYDGYEMISPSELRQINRTTNQRSRTIGAVDDIPVLGQMRVNSLANKNSMLQSLNVDSFDINDSASISHLIKVSYNCVQSFTWED